MQGLPLSLHLVQSEWTLSASRIKEVREKRFFCTAFVFCVFTLEAFLSFCSFAFSFFFSRSFFCFSRSFFWVQTRHSVRPGCLWFLLQVLQGFVSRAVLFVNIFELLKCGFPFFVRFYQLHKPYMDCLSCESLTLSDLLIGLSLEACDEASLVLWRHREA